MEHLENDYEDHPNQHENSHKLCDETRHPISSLLESQWKVRQQTSRTIFLTWCLKYFHEPYLKQLIFTIDMIKQKHLEFMIKINHNITY